MDTVLFSGDDLYQRLQQKISIALFCSRFRRLHHVIRFHKVDVKAIMMNVRFQTSLLALLSAILPVTAFSAVPENCPQVPSSPLEQGESKKQYRKLERPSFVPAVVKLPIPYTSGLAWKTVVLRLRSQQALTQAAWLWLPIADAKCF